MAKDNNLSPTQMALAYVSTRPFLTSNIIGATNIKQLNENISSTNIELSNELLNSIENICNDFPYPCP